MSARSETPKPPSSFLVRGPRRVEAGAPFP